LELKYYVRNDTEIPGQLVNEVLILNESFYLGLYRFELLLGRNINQRSYRVQNLL